MNPKLRQDALHVGPHLIWRDLKSSVISLVPPEVRCLRTASPRWSVACPRLVACPSPASSPERRVCAQTDLPGKGLARRAAGAPGAAAGWTAGLAATASATGQQRFTIPSGNASGPSAIGARIAEGPVRRPALRAMAFPIEILRPADLDLLVLDLLHSTRLRGRPGLVGGRHGAGVVAGQGGRERRDRWGDAPTHSSSTDR